MTNSKFEKNTTNKWNRFALAYITLIMIMGAVVVYHATKKSKNNKMVTYAEKIPSTKIKSGNDRGGISYKENHYINSDAAMVLNSCTGDTFPNHNVRYKAPTKYILASLEVPYYIYKKPHDDILYVHKGVCFFKYKLFFNE